jgi:peptidoglycan/LPS O-acetylase OafA/YrhL
MDKSEVIDVLEAPRSRHASQIDFLNVLRGIAASLVVLFHLTVFAGAPYKNIITTSGDVGVDVFFVISGMVIPLSLTGRDYSVAKWPRFMLKRVIRLQPAYLISVALCIVLLEMSQRVPGFKGAGGHVTLGQFAANVFYAVPFTNTEWVNPVYWTLTYEMIFYIVLGVVFRPLFSRHIAYSAIFTALVVLLLRAVTGHWDYLPTEFFLGGALMRWYVGRDRPLVTAMAVAASFVVLATLAGAASLIAVAIATGGVVLLRERRFPAWLMLLGDISYSLYLIHIPIGSRVMNLGQRLGHGVLIEGAVLIVAVVITLVAAWLLYRFVEAPSQEMSRRFARL